MRRHRYLPFVPLLAASLGVAALSACSSSPPSSSSDAGGKVTITVQGFPPASDTAGRDLFMKQIAAFEKANPNITVKPSDSQWDPLTFAARLAGGNAETYVQVPLTEPAGLIKRKQVLDISSELAQWPAYKSYDKRLLQPNTDSAGKVYGLTYGQYTMGLNYSRGLFEKAGLDPNKPPTTWTELRAAAKAIHDKTGVTGFAETTTKNTGGWHLTAETYSRGGQMEVEQGGKQVANFDNQATKDALQLLHDMRWVDNSMGTNQLQGQEDVQRQLAAGQVGMYIDGPAAAMTVVQNYGGDKNDFGSGAMPTGSGGTGTLLGGTVGMITAKATAAEKAAAVKWMLFENIQQMYDPTAAANYAKAQADAKNVVLRSLPAFNQEVQAKIDAAVKPYLSLPEANQQPYFTGNEKLAFVPEPPVASQKVYAALDPVVQGVLTNQNADVTQLLAAAAAQAKPDIERAQA